MVKFVVALCSALTLTSASAKAQLVVDNLEMSIASRREARVVTSFNVRNPSDLPVQVTASREDWDRTLEGENRLLPSGSTSHTCGPLMNVYPLAFHLEPGGVQLVHVSVESGRDLSAECTEIVLMEQSVLSHGTAGRSSIQYVIRTGVKVYIAPQGLSAEASITGMRDVPVSRAKLARPTAGAPIGPIVTRRLAIQFQNSGGIHLQSHGRVEFRRLDNSVVAEIPIPGFPSLPGALRHLLIDIPGNLAPGDYVVLALIDYNGDEIAAGQLELHVD